MLWFLLLVGFTRFISSYFQLRKNASFIITNEKEIIEYAENVIAKHYEFKELTSLRMKGHTLLINNNPVLPTKIDLDITERDTLRLKTYFATHAKGIFVSFFSKGN
jgi:hypothetical protein